MSTEFTTEELKTLATVRPEFVGKLEDGTPVPTMDRDEFLTLAARYPSMKINTLRPSREANTERALALDAEAEEALRLRYPSMR